LNERILPGFAQDGYVQQVPFSRRVSPGVFRHRFLHRAAECGAQATFQDGRRSSATTCSPQKLFYMYSHMYSDLAAWNLHSVNARSKQKGVNASQLCQPAFP
jgi:hypothetical protein